MMHDNALGHVMYYTWNTNAAPIISAGFHLHPESPFLSPMPRRPSHFQFPPRFPFPASGLPRLLLITGDASTMPFHWSSSVLPSAVVTDSVVSILRVNISIKFTYRFSEKFKVDY